MITEMRLIDAHALAEELSSLSMIVTGLRAGKGFLHEYMTEYRKSVLRIVDEAPTIDPESLRPAWVPVTERLPEENDMYIVSAFDGHDRRITFAQWQNRVKRWYLTGARSYWKVTHWMPLPEPPKE